MQKWHMISFYCHLSRKSYSKGYLNTYAFLHFILMQHGFLLGWDAIFFTQICQIVVYFVEGLFTYDQQRVYCELIVMLSKCPITGCIHLRLFPNIRRMVSLYIHLLFIALLRSISFPDTNIPLGNWRCLHIKIKPAVTNKTKRFLPILKWDNFF